MEHKSSEWKSKCPLRRCNSPLNIVETAIVIEITARCAVQSGLFMQKNSD